MNPDNAAATVRSSLGELPLDSSGAPIGAARIDPQKSYAEIPALLKQVIDEDSAAAWASIREKIDYTYEGIDAALGSLDEATGFDAWLRDELRCGKKLLFKPNLVTPMCIDPITHGEGLGLVACTAWPFVAALMRWFHDRLDVSYHQMALGEAPSALSGMAGRFSILSGKRVTTEAAIEGRSGDFYGGWGFYFVRRYLAETHDSSHDDDPMKGYEDSVEGRYLPPGRANDRLPVYDLNRIQDIPSKGRDIPVPHPANFDSITIHKAVVGGEPSDDADMRDYPGCVLVNVPKLKVHALALLTNAVKNLGIGLYPMEAAGNDDVASTQWKYSSPLAPVPGMKSRVPHAVWVLEADDETGLPKRDAAGNLMAKRTEGLSGTMVDIIEAVQDQGVFIINAVDAIEATNVDHTSGIMGLKAPEGYVFASLDAVALDLLCARYMFKTVPAAEARRIQKERGLASEFLQRVPLPRVDGQNIVTDTGVDSPLSRYKLFDYARKRGIGGPDYHVIGRDLVAGGRLASLQGHLGRVDGSRFDELITDTFFFDASKILWDLQATVLAYAAANDALTGSDYHRSLVRAFDENGDGVIDYDEIGKKGIVEVMLFSGGSGVHLMATDPAGMLRGAFRSRANTIRWGRPEFNQGGIDVLKEYQDAALAMIAYRMSQLEAEAADPFCPGLTWGNGKWPTVQLARHIALGSTIYGLGYPLSMNIMSLYGAAFQHADRVYNGGRYTGDFSLLADPASLDNYLNDVKAGKDALPFTLYVPSGYGQCAGGPAPNVVETDDVEMMFSAAFAGGQEIW
ncbi:MAG: DUF362 domain-containing protein [Dehalococcoidia bacterium]|nr:DUF362 domain-containing protein [Dehalococcoidia bacterium]